MDDVLVDFTGAACKFHNKTFAGIPHSPDKQVERVPRKIEVHFQMTKPDLWDPLGFEFWRDLKPMPGCFEVVKILTDKFGEENICLLSSPIRTDGCYDGKLHWIRKHLPQFRRRFLIGPSKDFAASPRNCLVDDHEGNTNAFIEAGGHAFIVPAPWNRKYKEHPVQALREWIAALDVIGKNY
jgi:5'(3')-deoxyribonucleotidase